MNSTASGTPQPLLDKAGEITCERVEAVGFFRSAAQGRTALLSAVFRCVLVAAALAATGGLAYGVYREGGFAELPIRYSLGTLLIGFLLVLGALWAGRALADRMSAGTAVSLPERIVMVVTADKVHLFKWDIVWLPAYWKAIGPRAPKIPPAFASWTRGDVRITERRDNHVSLTVAGQANPFEVEPLEEVVKAKEDIMIAAAKASPEIAVRSAGWEHVIELLSAPR